MVKHTVHRLIWAWQYEKEEKWLNEMSAKGMQLASVGFCRYVFEESSYNEYTYRLEMLKGWINDGENIAYIRFLEDMGIEHVATFGRWAYFRKKTSDEPFELYSDNTSKIRHFRRILQLIVILGCANLVQMPNMFLRFLDSVKYGEDAVGFGIIAILCLELIIVTLFITGSISIYRKIRKLKKNSSISE